MEEENGGVKMSNLISPYSLFLGLQDKYLNQKIFLQVTKNLGPL